MGSRMLGWTISTLLLFGCGLPGPEPVGPPAPSSMATHSARLDGEPIPGNLEPAFRSRTPDDPDVRIPVSVGVAAGFGAATGHLRRLSTSRDVDLGPVVGARLGSVFGRTGVWLLGDYQAFRVRRPAGGVGAFYLLGAVQVAFETGRLEVGAGAVQHRLGDDDPTGAGRTGWAAGARAVRPLGAGFQAELGWKFGRSAAAETQLLALQIARYWELF